MKDGRALKVTTPSEREIAMTYEFDAPRSLVFQAWTKPELMCRWMGPPDGSMSIRELDLEVGGGYRFVWRGADGAETESAGCTAKSCRLSA